MANPHGNRQDFDCCGGAHKVTYTQEGVRQEVVEEDMPEILMEFTGHRVGSFSISGPVSKRSYRFSIFERTKPVDERDVEGILAKCGDFSVAGGRRFRQPAARRDSRQDVAVAEDRQAGGSPSFSESTRQAQRAASEATQVVRRPPSEPKMTRRSQVEDRGTFKPDLSKMT